MLGRSPANQYDNSGHAERMAGGEDPHDSHRSKRVKTDDLLYGSQYVERAVGIMAQLHSALITHNPSNARVHMALVNHAGSRADTSASQRVLNARRALGADDEAYLSTGIMLLWAGDYENDEELDKELLLYPTSDRSIGRSSEGPARGWVAAMDVEMRGRTDHAHALIGEVAGAMAVLMSLPDIKEYLREAVEMAGLVAEEDGRGLVAALYDEGGVNTEQLRRTIMQESTRLSVSHGEAAMEGTRNLEVIAGALADLWTAERGADADADAESSRTQGAASFVRELVDELPLLSARNARAEDAALLKATYMAEGDLAKLVAEQACSRTRLERSMKDTKMNEQGRHGVGPNTDHERPSQMLIGNTVDSLSRQLENARIEDTYAVLRAQQNTLEGDFEPLVDEHQHRGIDPGKLLSLKHRRLLAWDEAARTRYDQKSAVDSNGYRPVRNREAWESRSDLILDAAKPESSLHKSDIRESLAQEKGYLADPATKTYGPVPDGQYYRPGSAYRGQGNRACASIQGSVGRLLMPPVRDLNNTYQLSESDTLRCTIGRADYSSVAMKTFQTINAGIAAGAATLNGVDRAFEWTTELRKNLGIGENGNTLPIGRAAVGYGGTGRLQNLVKQLPEGLRRRSQPSVGASSSAPAIDRAITAMRRTLVSKEYASKRNVEVASNGSRVVSSGLRHFDQALWCPKAPTTQSQRGPLGESSLVQHNPDVADWAGYGQDTEAALEMVRVFYVNALSEAFGNAASAATPSTEAHDAIGVHVSNVSTSALRAGVEIARLDALQRLQRTPATKLRRIYENAVYSLDTPLDRQRVRVRVFFEPTASNLDFDPVGTGAATQMAARRLIARLDPGAAVVYASDNSMKLSMPVEGTSVQPVLPSVGVVEQTYTTSPRQGEQVQYEMRKQLSLQPGKEYEDKDDPTKRWTALYPQLYSFDDTTMQTVDTDVPDNGWNYAGTGDDEPNTWPPESAFKVPDGTDDAKALPKGDLTDLFARAMLTEFVTAMDWNAPNAANTIKHRIELVLGMEVLVSRPTIEVVPHVLGTRFVGVPGEHVVDTNSNPPTVSHFLETSGALSLSDTMASPYDWPSDKDVGLFKARLGSTSIDDLWVWQRMGLADYSSRPLTWLKEDPRIREPPANPANIDRDLMHQTAICSAFAFAAASPSQGANHRDAGIVKDEVFVGFDSKKGTFAAEYNRWKLAWSAGDPLSINGEKQGDMEEREHSRHNPNYKPSFKATPIYRQVDATIHLSNLDVDIDKMRPLFLIPRWNVHEGAPNFVSQLRVVLNTQRILQMYGTAVCCVDPAVGAAEGRWTLARTRALSKELFESDTVVVGSTWDGDPYNAIGMAWHRKRRGQLGGHHPQDAFPRGDIDLLTNRRVGAERVETPRACLAYARNTDDGERVDATGMQEPLRDANNNLNPEVSMVGILLLVRIDSVQETAGHISQRVTQLLGLPNRNSVRIWHSAPPSASPTEQAPLTDTQRVKMFREKIESGLDAEGYHHYPLDCPMTIACVDVLAEPSALPVQNSMEKLRRIKQQDMEAEALEGRVFKKHQGASSYTDARGRWLDGVDPDKPRAFQRPTAEEHNAITTSDAAYNRALFRSVVRPFYAPVRVKGANSVVSPLLQSLAAPMGPESGIIDALSDSRVAGSLYDIGNYLDSVGDEYEKGIRFLMQYAVHERAGRDIMLNAALAKKAHRQLALAVVQAIQTIIAKEAALTSVVQDRDELPQDMSVSSSKLLDALVSYMQTGDADAFGAVLRTAPNYATRQSQQSDRIASWAVSIARSPIVQAVAAAVARVPTHPREEGEAWEFANASEDAWVADVAKGAPFLVGVADGLLVHSGDDLYRQSEDATVSGGWNIFDQGSFQLAPANDTPDNPNYGKESLIEFEIRDKFDGTELLNERNSVIKDREDIWAQLGAADDAIDALVHAKNRLPDWMSSEGLRQIATAARDAATMLSSAARWRSNSDEIRNELRRVAEDRATRKQAERQRRSSLWLDAMRELAITNDRLYIFLRTLAGTLHEAIDAVIEVNDSSVQRAQEQERSRRTEALRKANDFSNRVMQTVFSSALKSAKLDFGLSGSEIVVLSQANVEEVRRLAEGESGVGYFEAAQRLQDAVSSPQGIPLERMMQSVAAVLQELRQQQVNAVDEQTSDVLRSSFEYLSAPRNSFTVRLKAEASAAIRTAWSTFCVEWAQQAMGRMRRPSAWELIEGPDNVLRTTFATYCAYQLSHSRIFSSSSAVYVSRISSQTNFSMMRVTLMKLINRASEYVRANPAAPNYRMNYRQNSAIERNPWGQSHGGFVDAAAMANAGIARQVAAGGVGGYGAPDWSEAADPKP